MALETLLQEEKGLDAINMVSTHYEVEACFPWRVTISKTVNTTVRMSISFPYRHVIEVCTRISQCEDIAGFHIISHVPDHHYMVYQILRTYLHNAQSAGLTYTRTLDISNTARKRKSRTYRYVPSCKPQICWYFEINSLAGQRQRQQQW